MSDPVYSPAFLKAIGFVMPAEEVFLRGHWGDENFVTTEYVPGDDGGLTKYGIDHASHPGVNIAALTKDEAVAIYYSQNWAAHHLDDLPAKIAIALFDVYVNGGFGVRWLQHAINVVNAPAPAGCQLAEDGVMGPATVKALQICNQDAIIKVFIEERNARFEALAQANAGDRKFLAGWENRDKALEGYLTA